LNLGTSDYWINRIRYFKTYTLSGLLTLHSFNGGSFNLDKINIKTRK